MDELLPDIGPYRILAVLGRGSMGVVYRGEHRETGELAAVKTVRVPTEGVLASLRREIHALARTAHPGIVRILGEGVQDGLPWYAMELLEGMTLRRWAGAQTPPTETFDYDPWGTRTLAGDAFIPGSSEASLGASGFDPALLQRQSGSEKSRAVLTLVRRLCAPLAYLHGEGIVHRDLKPDNILIRQDPGMRNDLAGAGLALPFEGEASRVPIPAEGEASRVPTSEGLRPVLADFGLVSSFGGDLSREALDMPGLVVGTAHYMAPEQVRGELVDARADLYALGCLLYELLAGRPPFIGRTTSQVLWQHLEKEPQPPSVHAEGVPAELDELVLRLLAKRPRDRPGHADGVAAALERLGAEPLPADAAPPARAYLYRPGLAGRADVLAELEARLGQLEEEHKGGIVLVGGESGVGKTRLVLELARLARQREIRVLAGECRGVGGRPLEALRKPLQEIADICRAGGAAETERLLGRRSKVLALYEPALQGLPGQVETQDIASLPADAAIVRLHGFLTETLAELGREPPLLLVLDDLQWADGLTLGWLEYFIRTLGEAQRAPPVLVIGTYRTEEVGARQASPLRRCIDTPGVGSVLLPRLEEASVGAMVAEMLALERVPELFGRFLSRQSEGNPFFVAEYLRTAVTEGVLYRDEASRWQVAEPAGAPGDAPSAPATEATYEALSLPPSIRELVGRRLAALPQPALDLAEAAAVLGREAEVRILQGMLALEEPALLEAASELLRRQVLEEPRPGELRFAHDKIRDVAYERIPADRRPELHRAAAEGIERLLGRDGHFGALARHWEQAGLNERARDCALTGARLATTRYAYGEAEQLYRTYLRLAEQPDLESVKARNELGCEVLHVQGRNQDALLEHQRALQESRQLADRRGEMHSQDFLGRIYWATGLPEQASLHFEQALALARERGDRQNEGSYLNSRAVLDMQCGRMEEARELYGQALAFARALGDRKGEVQTLNNLALLQHYQGWTAEARALCEQALVLVRELGDRFSEGYTLDNLGMLCKRQGAVEEASRLLEQALLCAREVDDRRLEGIVLGHLGVVHLEQGHLEEAASPLEKALQRAREVGDRRFEGIWQASRGRLLRQVGRLAEAARSLQEAEKLLRDAAQGSDPALAICETGHLSLAEHRSGRESLDEARRLAASLNARSQSESERFLLSLERAQTGFEEGRALFQGECFEDLPEALQRRLARTGQLPLGSEPAPQGV